MLRNYLIIAFRNLLRSPAYSFINIGGLAVGITSSVLILLWVIDEISFDRFHSNREQLHQVWIHATFSDRISSYESMPLPLYQYLKTADTRIKNTAVTDWGSNHLIAAGDQKFMKRGHFVSPEFLTMFKFPLISGDPSRVLAEPTAIVISQRLANALFGTQDPLNQLIRIDNQSDFKVSGVLKDVPDNSTFQFDYLLPWSVYAQMDWVKQSETQWDNESFPIYAELAAGVEAKEVNPAIEKIISEKNPDAKRQLFLHPMADWHLRSTFKDGKPAGGAGDYVSLFAAIALFVLVIACINFMNMATARSERRAREVGVRKAIGSRRSELIYQFLGESFLIVTLATLIALVFIELSLPFYNSLVNKHLSIDYSSIPVWLSGLGLILVVGLFAGSYPAFYLSSFNPAKVLKGKLMVGAQGATPRKILVAIQFLVAISLIGGTVVIYQQINLVKGRPIGYDKENLMMVTSNDELAKNYKALKEDLVQSGVAVSVTGSASPITAIYGNNTLEWPGMPQGQQIIFSRVTTDYLYTKTMGIKVLEGRDFSESFKSDTAAMLLNQAAVDVMGLENPIGAQVGLWSRKWTVVGVLENTLMASPFRAVPPGFFLLQPAWLDVITIRLKSADDLPATIKSVEAIFRKHNPTYPFEYSFVDDDFNKKFASIEMIGTLANLFAFLALFITGLGLYGLAAFTAEQRTKEIGIRKVMGASTLSIVRLLSRDFANLVFIGFAIAAPVAWWGLGNFLERYDYRVNIQWWVLPLAGMMALFLVLVVVASQAARAAQANPVESLRSE
ncbi:MAG: ABC transporter permease [Cyclobacteriaceae bacterium]